MGYFKPLDMPKIHHGEELPPNTTCLVWRHARWYVVRENEKGGMMFELKGTQSVEIEAYDGNNWGYTKTVKTMRQGGGEAAIDWMEEQVKR